MHSPLTEMSSLRRGQRGLWAVATTESDRSAPTVAKVTVTRALPAVVVRAPVDSCCSQANAVVLEGKVALALLPAASLQLLAIEPELVSGL